MAKNTVVVSITANNRGFKKGLGESTSALSKLGSIAKGSAKVVAGVGVALAGLAAAGGFARALKMDEARVQLKALGYSAGQVTGIMDSALKSVKGTAFGLDAAATIAANALASGVPEGERLTKALTTVANTAALAKTDMGDMGAIFQKVWANGKVTTQEMNQLADRGVPIWQYLSEAFGVSNAELRKMIETGQVTADMFESALGPAVDGMATKMSDSFKGMLANAGAALSRLGALFTAPLLAAAKPAIAEFTKLVDGIGEAFAPVADKFESALSRIKIDGLADRIINAFKNLEGHSPAEIVLQLVARLADGIVKAGPKIASGIQKMISGLARTITKAAPVITKAAVMLLTALAKALPTIITALVGALVGALGALIPAIVDMIPVLLDAAVTLFTALAQAIPVILPVLLDGIVTAILALVPALLGMIPTLLDAAVNLLTALIDALPVILPKLIAGIIGLIPVIIVTLIGLIPRLLTAAIDLFTALVTAIPLIIPNVIIELVKMAPQIVRSLIGMLPQLLDAAVKLFTAIITAIPTIAGKLGPALAKLLPRMVTALKNMIPDLERAGRDLIAGLANGLARNGRAVVNKLLGIARGAINAFKNFFGIHSPSKLMGDMGVFLNEGLAAGINRSLTTVRGAVGKLNNTVTDTFDATLDVPPVTVTPGARPTNSLSPTDSAGARIYQITIQALGSSYEIGKAVVDAIHEYERIAGGRAATGGTA